MLRQWLQILLVLGLLLQGVASVGADVVPQGSAEDHCPDSGSLPTNGSCCGGEGAMSAGCAAHCLVTDTHRSIRLPAPPAGRGMQVPPPGGAIPNPSYVPSLPPPIA